jgi:arylsulfatase A-like enzyme
MNRRQFLEAAGALAGATALSAQTRPDPPNIVFILADDLGYGDLGCYGQRRIHTPNLDALAKQGTRFTQAYAGSTVCAPSRCALMTGRHTGHSTIRGNKGPELGLHADEVTLPQLLKRAGYETAMFGKWGLGGVSTGSVPNTRGFDEFFGYLSQTHAHNYYPEHLWQNQEEFLLQANWFNRRRQYAPDLFTDRALKFLDRPRQKPFFLYLATTIPHADNELGAATGNGSEVPSDEPHSQEPWPPVEKNFAAMVTRLDRDVGRVLARLEERGLARNTLVVFSSDNGAHAEGNHDARFFSSSGSLRGIKRDLYEGGVRVPLIARWPGRIAAGALSDHVLAFWDFLPTFAEVAGAATPAGLDGISMAPALLGGSQRGHEYLYWEFHEQGFFQAVRMGDWKGVRKQGAAIELYDLKNDVGESRDVSASEPGVLRRIAELMAAARTDSPDFPVTIRR